MPKNEEGEFELVLGNRQLISVFLIVVILLGVFFSMGYIVGRNSAPGGPEVARTTKAAPESPADSSASAGTAAPPAEPPPAPATESKPAAREQVATQPEQPARAVETPKPVQPAAAKEKKSPVASPASERASVTGEPAPGLYWQVVATARPDAEIVAEALTKKGMHAIIAPAPRDGFFRVLVGPLPDAAAQAQTRTQLEAAGFKNPIVRKY